MRNATLFVAILEILEKRDSIVKQKRELLYYNILLVHLAHALYTFEKGTWVEHL